MKGLDGGRVNISMFFVFVFPLRLNFVVQRLLQSRRSPKIDRGRHCSQQSPQAVWPAVGQLSGIAEKKIYLFIYLLFLRAEYSIQVGRACNRPDGFAADGPQCCRNDGFQARPGDCVLRHGQAVCHRPLL